MDLDEATVSTDDAREDPSVAGGAPEPAYDQPFDALVVGALLDQLGGPPPSDTAPFDQAALEPAGDEPDVTDAAAGAPPLEVAIVPGALSMDFSDWDGVHQFGDAARADGLSATNGGSAAATDGLDDLA